MSDATGAGGSPFPAGTNALEYPDWLLSVLRFLLIAGAVMVWVFPIPAGALSIVFPHDALVDSGGKGAVARPFLQTLILFCLVPFVLGPNAWRSWERGFRLATLAFLLSWGAAAAFSVDRFESSWTWMELFTSVAFMVVVRQVCCSPGGMDRFARLAVAVACVLAVMALGHHALIEVPYEAVVGTFYQADVAAGYFLLLVPPALGLLVGHSLARFQGGERGPVWLLYGAGFVLLLATMILTYSRGALLSIAAVGMVLLPVGAWGCVALARAGGWPVLRVSGVLAVIVIVAGLGGIWFAGAVANPDGGLVPKRVSERAASLVGPGDSSVVSRLDFWWGAARMAWARPWLGWGPACFGRVYPRYQGDVRFYSRYTHSQYLTFAAEGGLVTLGAFLALAVVVFALLARRLRDGLRLAVTTLEVGKADWPAIVQWFVLLGLAGGLGAGLVHLVVDVDWEFPVVRTTWFGLAGMAVAGEAAEAWVRGPSRLVWRFTGAVLVLVLIAVQPMPWAAAVAEREARFARESGDLAGSVAAMRTAVRWMPGSSLYRRELAECLLAVGAREGADSRRLSATLEAVVEARKAVRLDAERAVNHEALANALVASGDLQGAAVGFRDAIARDPVNYPGFYNMLASLLAREGRAEDALATLAVPASLYASQSFSQMWGFREESLRQQLTQTWLAKGRLEQLVGRVVEARGSFVRAVELDGANIGARFNLGLLLMEMGEPGEAYVHFSEILARKPGNAISLWLMGISCREMGQDARAFQFLDQAYALRPDLRTVGQKGHSLQVPPEFFESGQKVPKSHRLELRG